MARTNRLTPTVRPLDDRCVPDATVPGTPDPVPVPVSTIPETPAPAAVSGLVYADLNGSGVQEAGEPALANVTVTLNSAEGKAVSAALTSGEGKFTFTSVADGAYQVVASPTGNGINASTVVRPVSVTGGQSVGPVTLGVRASGSVAGRVYADVNGNNRFDTGEAGVAGATVTLDLFAGGTRQSTTVAADGSYKFAAIPDGLHKLTAVAGGSYLATTQGPVSVSVIGGADATLDVGFRPVSAISGTVSLGTAKSGVGLPGATVTLDLNGDGKADAVTTTDAAGNYLFAGVPAGTHVVSVTAPGATGFDTPTGANKLVVSTTGDVRAGNNVGVSFAGKIDGSAFLDANGNGKYEAGDSTFTPPTVTVDLYNSGQTITVPVTNKNGAYQIANVPDGTHTVTLPTPGGYAATTATRVTATVTGGGRAVVPDVGYQAAGGTTVAVGNGEAAGATTFTFTPGPNGTLTTVQGNVVTPGGRPGGSTRTVSADVNGDGVDDLITGNGPGGAPLVRIYDGKTNNELVGGGILVFESTFTGGLNLSAGDFLKTGKAQIVVSADNGGGPRVRVLNPLQYLPGADPAGAKVVADFFGIADPDFRGGARTAVGDLNADGTPDLVVAAGQGGGPRVAVFDGRTVGGGGEPVRLMADFFAYESGLRNGAVVAVGDVNGDGKGDLITGAGPGGAPRVSVLDGRTLFSGGGTGTGRLADFFVNGDSTGRAGTRLTVKDLDADGKADLIATNGGRAFVFTGPSLLATYLTNETPVAAGVLNPFPQVSRGGLFVG
jgi:hypothetical protein